MNNAAALLLAAVTADCAAATASLYSADFRGLIALACFSSWLAAFEFAAASLYFPVASDTELSAAVLTSRAFCFSHCASVLSVLAFSSACLAGSNFGFAFLASSLRICFCFRVKGF